jgi:hypothetical protein
MVFERNRRQPKAGANPESRQIKTGGDPDSLETQTLAWQFRRMDTEDADWGWQLTPQIWAGILTSLKNLEGLTWAELKAAAGGRRVGTNHHSLTISQLTQRAQQRLAHLHLDQYDKVFSLRLTNTVRVYGIRDGRVLRLLWRDCHHGTERGVCPTNMA